MPRNGMLTNGVKWNRIKCGPYDPELVCSIVVLSRYTASKILKICFQIQNVILFRKLVSRTTITNYFCNYQFINLRTTFSWSWPMKVQQISESTKSRHFDLDLVWLSTKSRTLSRIWSICPGCMIRMLCPCDKDAMSLW